MCIISDRGKAGAGGPSSGEEGGPHDIACPGLPPCIGPPSVTLWWQVAALLYDDLGLQPPAGRRSRSTGDEVSINFKRVRRVVVLGVEHDGRPAPSSVDHTQAQTGR